MKELIIKKSIRVLSSTFYKKINFTQAVNKQVCNIYIRATVARPRYHHTDYNNGKPRYVKNPWISNKQNYRNKWLAKLDAWNFILHNKGSIVVFENLFLLWNALMSEALWRSDLITSPCSTDKRKTCSEYLNKKIGIYMFENKITKKKYIGKSINLHKRVKNYLDDDYRKNNPTNINRAITKFKLNNFKFSILEYCNKEELSSREQYYIDKYKPQYNIRKIVCKK